MAITRAIQQAQARNTGRNRQKNRKAALRMDERLDLRKARTFLTAYKAIDAEGDRSFSTEARRHYDTINDDAERRSFERVVAAWMKEDERLDRLMAGALDHSDYQIFLHHRNTPAFVEDMPIPSEWLDNSQVVPAGMNGAA